MSKSQSKKTAYLMVLPNFYPAVTPRALKKNLLIVVIQLKSAQGYKHQILTLTCSQKQRINFWVNYFSGTRIRWFLDNICSPAMGTIRARFGCSQNFGNRTLASYLPSVHDFLQRPYFLTVTTISS